MDREKDIMLLNAADERGLLPVLFANLVSSEALLSEDACLKAIELLTGFKEAIPETQIGDKEYWLGMADGGIEVAKRDLERYRNNG